MKEKISRFLGKFITKVFGNKFAYYCKYPFDRKTMIKALKKGEKKNNKKIMQNFSKIAIIFIGTDKYIDFFPKYYLTVKKKFLPNTKKDFFVFTDIINYGFLKNKPDVIIIKTNHEKWPFSTLLRFRSINKISDKLEEYSHIIYIDADMYVNEIIPESEFFAHDKSLFGVQHDSYTNKQGEFEKNTKSTAAVSEKDDLRVYRVGAFWGGKKQEFLKMVNELKKRVEKDLKNNIIAKWHDESQLNKYFIEHKTLVHTFAPSYAYPNLKPIPKPFKKKIIHLLQSPIKEKTYNRNFSR